MSGMALATGVSCSRSQALPGNENKPLPSGEVGGNLPVRALCFQSQSGVDNDCPHPLDSSRPLPEGEVGTSRYQAEPGHEGNEENRRLAPASAVPLTYD